MKGTPPPIPVHQLALLQAYLYEVFAYEKQCHKNFSNSEWYLRQKHNEEVVNSILEFFRSNNINCDCDIINKFDIRKYVDSLLHYHH